MKPLSLRSFPRAILHIDGDSFFASCEQAMNPALRGKPVVTGAERGIASAMSYEAKARGVTRAMPLWQIKKICPEAIILPSNYEAYSLYAMRMYTIVRRYTPTVEEYSIDECFADLTGMRRTHRLSYVELAHTIKAELDRELGFTFSVGLGPSKVLAKVGSKWDKPSGCVAIPAREAHQFLAQLQVGEIWGIGTQTSNFLQGHRIITALDFALRSESWISQHLSKPYQQIHQELRGISVLPIETNPQPQQSISKTKTFTPPSANPSYVMAQLSKNVENACIKARRHHLYAQSVSFFFKTQDFRYHGGSLTLSRAVNTPSVILSAMRHHVSQAYQPGILYRGSGVTLGHLQSQPDQPDLFSESVKVENYAPVYIAVDSLSRRYGKHTVRLGSSQLAHTNHHLNSRHTAPERHHHPLRGENKRKRLGIPCLGSTN